MSGVRVLLAVPARSLIAVLRAYRYLISPMRPPACRFTPSCSEYALTAIGRFGALRGGWLALRRLLRCHPYHRGGHDPVPDPVVSRDVERRMSDALGSPDEPVQQAGTDRSPDRLYSVSSSSSGASRCTS